MKNTLKDEVYKAVINLHRKTGKEWIHLGEVYQEVGLVREIKNGGASIRAILETHCLQSEAFNGKEELYVLKEKGSGLYKSVWYERLREIEALNVGRIFTNEQLMEMFKVNGQRRNSKN